MYDLSVIITARNEEFLQRTIDDILSNIEGKTEIIAILDGYWPDPGIKDDNRVTLIHHTKSTGQRASVNEGVRISKAKYIMKCDAHCAFDKGFDVKLMADCKSDWTVIPRMYNLHAFDWVCECGHNLYQGPTPDKCPKCQKKGMTKKIIWKPRKSRKTDFATFDNNMKFQYWKGYESRPEAKGDIADVMSFVGACFFMERKRYWDLEGLDEKHGSWGQMGTEISCKTWLSGGRQVVNKKTWFAHMFRTRGSFSFPYPIKHSDQEKARIYSRDIWLNDKWPKAKKSLSCIIDKFSPVPTWNEKPKWRDVMPILSVIIPARNEKYLQNTIDDICKNFTSNFEIIVGLDNCDAKLKKNPKVAVYKSKKRVGMRALINKMVSLSKSRFIMKTDAHCSFSKGYDQKLIDVHKKGYTLLGVRYELDVNKWQRKERTNCDFRYLSNPDIDKLGGLRGLPWHAYKKKTKGEKLSESMSLSGSGWLMEKAQFDSWGGLDGKNHGTMYQEGVEIACKTWLTGGRLLINKDAWYAHWNRGKAPYALSGKHRQKSIDYSIDLWMGNKWPLQKYSFNWLLKHFGPVPGWPEIKINEIPAKRQGVRFKGSNHSKNIPIDFLWENRLGIAEPLKRWRIEILYNSLWEYITELDKGKKFTPNDWEKTRYYNYLTTHLAKVLLPQDFPKWQKKYKTRLHRKMKEVTDIFYSIKKEGLKQPLEFYRDNGKTYLWKGYRRFIILKVLGVKSVPVVTHMDIRCKELPSHFPRRRKYTTSIEELAEKQFLKYKGKATDKYWVHRYTPIYDKLFNDYRRKKIKILEIGVLRGASLRLWHNAFPRASIYGLDKNMTFWKEMTKDLKRVKVYVGKQEDIKLLDKIKSQHQFEIIIDDCGHSPESQLLSFKHLWPTLKTYGYYVIEDCYRSYQKKNLNIPDTLARMIKNIYTDHSVLSVQFYYNLCVIQKGI